MRRRRLKQRLWRVFANDYVLLGPVLLTASLLTEVVRWKFRDVLYRVLCLLLLDHRHILVSVIGCLIAGIARSAGSCHWFALISDHLISWWEILPLYSLLLDFLVDDWSRRWVKFAPWCDPFDDMLVVRRHVLIYVVVFSYTLLLLDVCVGLCPCDILAFINVLRLVEQLKLLWQVGAFVYSWIARRGLNSEPTSWIVLLACGCHVAAWLPRLCTYAHVLGREHRLEIVQVGIRRVADVVLLRRHSHLLSRRCLDAWYTVECCQIAWMVPVFSRLRMHRDKIVHLVVDLTAVSGSVIGLVATLPSWLFILSRNFLKFGYVRFQVILLIPSTGTVRADEVLIRVVCIVLVRKIPKVGLRQTHWRGELLLRVLLCFH